MLFLAPRQSRTIYLDFLEDSINFTVLSLNFNTLPVTPPDNVGKSFLDKLTTLFRVGGGGRTV